MLIKCWGLADRCDPLRELIIEMKKDRIIRKPLRPLSVAQDPFQNSRTG